MKASKNAYKRYFKLWTWTKNRTRQIGPTPLIEVPDEMGPDEMGGRFLCPVSCGRRPS